MLFYTSIFNCSGGNIYPQYMCIVVYMILIGCNDIEEIYCPFGGVGASSVYALSAICDTYLV